MRVLTTLFSVSLALMLSATARADDSTENSNDPTVKVNPQKDTTLLSGTAPDALRDLASQPSPKILYEEDHTLLTSTVQVVVLTGAADDPAGKNGLANALSELMLRGTKKKKRTAFQSEIERMGARLSVRASHDMIVFVGRVIKENTLPFLKLIEEAVLTPALDKKEFESLRKETLAEISHMKNSNGRLAGLALRRTLMAGTVLERPTDGTLSTVKAISHDDILRAYNDRFNRGNFVFAVASALPEADVKKPLTEMWLKLPDGAHRARKSIAPSVPSKPTIVVVNKPKTSTGSVMFGQAGIIAQDPDRYSLAVGNYSFGGEPLVSRLFRIVRGQLGYTYAVGSTYNAMGPLSNQQGFYVVSTTPSVEFTAKTILKVLSMWHEYMKKGLDSDELELARESLINSYPFEFESAEKRLSQRLYSYLYSVPLLNPDQYTKMISAIDNGRIKEALKQRQSADGWLVAVVADRAVIDKELAEEQKDVPAEKRIVVSKQLAPEDLIK